MISSHQQRELIYFDGSRNAATIPFFSFRFVMTRISESTWSVKLTLKIKLWPIDIQTISLPFIWISPPCCYRGESCHCTTCQTSFPLRVIPVI